MPSCCLLDVVDLNYCVDQSVISSNWQRAVALRAYRRSFCAVCQDCRTLSLRSALPRTRRSEALHADRAYESDTRSWERCCGTSRASLVRWSRRVMLTIDHRRRRTTSRNQRVRVADGGPARPYSGPESAPVEA